MNSIFDSVLRYPKRIVLAVCLIGLLAGQLVGGCRGRGFLPRPGAATAGGFTAGGFTVWPDTAKVERLPEVEPMQPVSVAVPVSVQSAAVPDMQLRELAERGAIIRNVRVERGKRGRALGLRIGARKNDVLVVETISPAGLQTRTSYDSGVLAYRFTIDSAGTLRVSDTPLNAEKKRGRKVVSTIAKTATVVAVAVLGFVLLK